MALKTFVKVSTVNNLSDARYCAGMEVDLIGFNLEEGNPNYTSANNYKELTEWLSGVKYVGEFEKLTADEIIETAKLYDVDYLQVGQVSLIEKLTPLNKAIILKTSITEASKLPSGLDITYLLIAGDDQPLSENDILTIKKISTEYNVLLGTGITDDNVDSLLEKTTVKGIALQGGDELRPGFKDYDELADILEALEIEN